MEQFLKKEYMVLLFTLLICFLLCTVSKKILYRLFKLNKKVLNDGRKKTIINLISYIIRFIIIAIGFLTVLEAFGVDTKSLVTSLGVVGLIAGLAIQDLLKDFIVGITIIFEAQYSIGDWVSINGFKGEVIPSSLRNTKLRAYTGEVKIISNRNITEIINYSLEKTNLIVDVDVDYSSNIEKVRRVLDNLCSRLKSEYKLKEITCLGIQELSSSSIKFRINAVSDYQNQFSLDRTIKKEIVLEFKKNSIIIPYNQVVVHGAKGI